MINSPTAFRLDHVTVQFPAVRALDDVSLEIREGEFLVMVGPSGSGKSTILNIVGGLDTASQGRVFFRDKEMTSFTASELTRYRRDTVGFVSQFYNLVPNLSARENVMVSTEISGDPLEVDDALGMVGLEERLLHPEVGGRRVGWNEALDLVAAKFSGTIREHGPDSVAFYVSGQLLTEDYYVANKLMKGFIGSANIDTNSRLCMASSVAGHRRAFGSDTVPGIYEDLELALARYWNDLERFWHSLFSLVQLFLQAFPSIVKR